MPENNNVIFKTSTNKTIDDLLNWNKTTGVISPKKADQGGVDINPGAVYFTSDGHIIYDLDQNTRLWMSKNAYSAIYAEDISNDIDNEIDSTTVYYGTCNTSASTRAKTVACQGFILTTGVTVIIKMTNAQTYNTSSSNNVTLNINGTGAINLKAYGTTQAPRFCWVAGEIITVVYDGTNYVLLENGFATTTYYGMTKLATSATSTSTSLALTPASLNSLVNEMISNYPVYSTTTAYSIGDRVRYNYQTWECNTSIAEGGEPWNAEHWTPLSSLQEQIDNKADKATTLAGYGITDAATSNHIHGYITNDGKITTNLATGESLANYHIIGTKPDGTIVKLPTAFNGSTETKFLTQKGTWKEYVLPTASTATLGGIKIGTGLNVNNDGVASVNISDLGLSSAMHFIGISSSSISHGGIQNPTINGTEITTKRNGDVVLYKEQEFVWNGSSWQLLGDESSYKIKQEAVTDPSAAGTSTTFIETITQNANGVITATKANLPTASNNTLGGIKTGYSDSTPKRYAIQVDNNSGKAYVDVPWTDTDTATAADDILDGSNSGTQITYAPYASQRNKLSFDTSSTAPSRTDRLNLNGYLYATKVYSGAKEVITSASELLTTSPFAPNSLRGPYISKIDNAFYTADKRWNVTTNIGNRSVLFDGNYDAGIEIPAGENTLTVVMDFSQDEASFFPGYGYPYGNILVSFYDNRVPSAVTGKVYYHYWDSTTHEEEQQANLTFNLISDSTDHATVYKARQSYYKVSKMEFTITSTASAKTRVVQIEMHLDRPSPTRNPFLSKYGPETLYYDLTAPTFIGNLTGTASKATADANGNIITSTYKTKQTVITDSTGTAQNDTATRFIYSISQNENGEISVKTRALPILSIAQGGTNSSTALTANRLMRSNSNGNAIVCSSNIYSDGSKLGVNTSSVTSGYYFEVNGASLFKDNLFVGTDSDTITKNIFVKNANGTIALTAGTSGARGLYDTTNNRWMLYYSPGVSNDSNGIVRISTWANKGSSSTPIYFNSNGEPQAITNPLPVTLGGTGQNNTNNFVKVYTRSQMGDSINYDNPGVNGLFEARRSSEIAVTGKWPGGNDHEGYFPLLSLTTSVAMMQIAGNSASNYGWWIRGKQGSSVTLEGVDWERLVTNSGTWNINITGNAATATTAGGITSAGTTAQFWRGDNTWSNILAQPAGITLGINTSDLRIGQTIRTLHIATKYNGTGTGITEGDSAGITFGVPNAAYAGIYYQSSGGYGSRLYFATTGSFNNGAYARMIITHQGRVGINTLSPSTRLHVEGDVTVTSLDPSRAVFTDANKKLVSADLYWANIKATLAASYNKTPEVANIKLNGNTSATAASAKNVQLVYDTSLEVLNFVFS